MKSDFHIATYTITYKAALHKLNSNDTIIKKDNFSHAYLSHMIGGNE